ncbi:ATP-dependent zinc metalloprotease FtsH [Desulfovibrio litoralis]|uniref:ATP-dependent zinc metalloprotease FtsH n=1 Tax=Desulfovibrio litoralis DSM 11393 TaxID=1121455 RepID=A0A1M7T439_9BACT|nr:ATP-dependent zinc metalloprotease FtsH [Desulfovibrio litoralis]SHN65503.1 membrane protease FtsH catalytic subunit [Desulfovibrio litoralis DSM 11393]
MNQTSRNFFFSVAFLLLIIVLFQTFNQPQDSPDKIDYSAFIEKVEQKDITSVVIQGQKLTGEGIDNKKFQSYAPIDPKMVERFFANKLRIKAEPVEDSAWYSIFISWLPMLIFIGIWIYFIRQMQGGGGKAMSFGRSRARLLNQETPKVTFKDVAGVDEAKEELSEVVDFLSNPKKYTRLGGRIPKGILLVGPPGTGKTLLARAVAGEAGVPFFSISGSDFVEMFVGVGASRVRDLFVQGKKNAPCIIFIDEIDAVGRQRGAGLGGGHDEREQTLNQLLVEMDGFESNEGVILIAATNRPDVLDQALLRPGRFDRQVVVPVPDLQGRLTIFQVYGKKTKLASDVDLDILARGTPGFSGADIENLVNEAALNAAKLNKDLVYMDDFESAKDKVIMGKERRSLFMTEEERKTTAYHESGHALIGKLLPYGDPLHKVTIIPRGRALGLTMNLPERDVLTRRREYFENSMVMILGGRAAELIVFNQLTTGASNDIVQVTKMARKMVCDWGMSDAIGPVFVSDNDGGEVFIGRDWGQMRHVSDETARLIDAEIKRMITVAAEQAERLLRENRDVLDRMATALLERETLTSSEVDIIIKNEDLPPLILNEGKQPAQPDEKTNDNDNNKPDTTQKPAEFRLEDAPADQSTNSQENVKKTEEKSEDK